MKNVNFIPATRMLVIYEQETNKVQFITFEFDSIRALIGELEAALDYEEECKPVFEIVAAPEKNKGCGGAK